MDSPLNSLQNPIWIFWIAFVCEKIFQIQQRLHHYQITRRCVFFLLFHRFFEFIFFIWTSYYKTKYILWKRMKISITLYCPTRHCLLFDYKYSTCYRCTSFLTFAWILFHISLVKHKAFFLNKSNMRVFTFNNAEQEGSHMLKTDGTTCFQITT